MKNQPEHISKMQEKVEEIRLAQEEANLAKDKVSTPLLRAPYYESFDKLMDLDQAANKLGDGKLKGAMKKIFVALAELKKQMDNNYIWD